MEEKDFPRQIEKIKTEWLDAFKQMQNYYETEGFKSFGIEYDASTWYQFKNPALIFPAEREMRFSTPNSHIKFDYYPSPLAKLGITGHNFAYLADIEEFYSYNFAMFLWEQKEYITPLQRANLRTAHFIPDAVVEVTKQGLRSFLKARGEEEGIGAYEEPFVTLEMLGLMGMPRRDDILNFFKEMYEDNTAAFDLLLETPYFFAFAGLTTPPGLNEEEIYGIKRREKLSYVKTLIGRYVRDERGYEELSRELEEMGYITMVEDDKPEDSVDLRWVKLDHAMERIKKVISDYEHKAAHSDYYCYADMAEALRRIYEKERTACSAYV